MLVLFHAPTPQKQPQTLKLSYAYNMTLMKMVKIKIMMMMMTIARCCLILVNQIDNNNYQMHLKSTRINIVVNQLQTLFIPFFHVGFCVFIDLLVNTKRRV